VSGIAILFSVACAGAPRIDYPQIDAPDRIVVTLGIREGRTLAISDHASFNVLSADLNAERTGWDRDFDQLHPFDPGVEPGPVMYMHLYLRGSEVATLTLDCGDTITQSRDRHHFAYKASRKLGDVMWRLVGRAPGLLNAKASSCP
jgi:hypothetical protein